MSAPTNSRLMTDKAVLVHHCAFAGGCRVYEGRMSVDAGLFRHIAAEAGEGSSSRDAAPCPDCLRLAYLTFTEDAEGP